MLEKLAENQVLFYFAGITILFGTILKVMVSISLKRLVKAASNMSKSNHSLMRLVRAKFEHACMISDKVQNVPAFVDKYLYEYKVLGICLHSFRQAEKTMIWLCGIIGVLGSAIAYFLENDMQNFQKYVAVGGGGALYLLLLQVTLTEQNKLEAAKMYMVEFLENTYAHRYEKTAVWEATTESKVMEKIEEPERKKEEMSETEPMKPIRPKIQSEPEVQPVQADKIREILEEFLA